MVKVVNMAGGGDLGVPLNLRQLSAGLDAEFTEYEPETFSGLTIRFHSDNPTIIAFGSGKYNIAGATSKEELQATRDEFVQAVSKMTPLDSRAQSNLEIRSIVYMDSWEHEIDLDAVENSFESQQVNRQKNPPCLDYKPPEFDGTIKIFRTGKILAVGTKSSTGEVERVLTQLHDQFFPPDDSESR